MKSFDRQSLEDQTRLVSRYVAGDLSRSERADFEAWLIASPELAAEVEMERRLRRGIASAARRGWLRRGPPIDVARDRRWRMAMAASVVLAITVAALSLVRPTRGIHRPETGSSMVSAIPHVPTSRTIRLGSVRGVSGAPDITVSLADAPDTLVIEPDVVVLTCEDGTLALECAGGAAPQTPQYPEYEMDLANRRSAALEWRSARQAPSEHSLLSFTLGNVPALRPGDYDLTVRGHAADHDEVVARFWLRVAAS